MFLLNAEIPAAVCSFAPKFADILRRRFILYGEDPFASISIPREAEIRQLKQQLLNMTLRLRSVYVARSLSARCLRGAGVHVLASDQGCQATGAGRHSLILGGWLGALGKTAP